MGCGMKRLMLLTSVLLLVSSTARTQQGDVATDTELRVAYCLGFTEQFQASIPSTLEFFADRLRVRLLGYIQARGLLGDVRSTAAKSGVIAAQGRGWADGVESQAARAACDSKCVGSSNQSCRVDCLEDLEDYPAYRWLKRCIENDPLPY